MKTILFTLLVILSSTSFAQFKSGSRVLTTTISYVNAQHSKNETSFPGNLTNTTSFTGIQFQPEITYGKIKNNILWSYGIAVGFGFGTAKSEDFSGSSAKSKSRNIAFSPTVSYEKFYLLSGNIYYSPFSRLAVGYTTSRNSYSASTSVSHQHGWFSGVDLYLFSLTIARNAKTNFLLRAGGVSLLYNHSKSFKTPDQSTHSSSTNDNFSATAGLGNITIGLQKFL